MLHDLRSQICYEYFCVSEQKYATIADELAFHLKEKVVAFRLPKLLILVMGARGVQFSL